MKKDVKEVYLTPKVPPKNDHSPMENFIGKKIDQKNPGRENSPGFKKVSKKIGVSDLEAIEKRP